MNLITIALGFISQLLIIKFFIIKTVRIKTRHFEKLYRSSKNEDTKKFILKESLEDKEDCIPSILNGFFKIKGFPLFYVLHDEQLMQAGFESKRTITEITIFRWKFYQLKKITDSYDKEDKKDISVYITSGNSERYLGSLKIDNNSIIMDIYNRIEQDCIDEIRTSFLLYGPPGNGKTTFIRNLAKKYGYDLYYVDVNITTTNTDIISLTSFIPNKAIVLFEDFDSVYDKRKVIKFEKPSFSFDAILNLIDGVYNENNQIIYAFTCNDISKIDDSLLNRRGRVKHVLEVGNPNYETRLLILGDAKKAYESDGLSLDAIYHKKITKSEL